MAVSIKEEGMILLEPPDDFVTTSGDPETENVEAEDDLDEEQAEILKANGPPADIELEKLPRPVSSLNCRQARSYLVKLLRAANGGQNPQYGNPNSKPPFWPDYYWPWSKLTDVHTKPRGMEEPLLYSEMMKLAIQRGYKYYGYDPENYWDKVVEEKEPAPVERGTPAPILSHQVENLGLPPKLPRPNSKLNCVQARTVLSKLLRYQQAGNNPVYGHPETRPPWWPDECIRWSDMVDLRGKPPYLPPDMTYTDVLKHAIDKGLQFFGYDAETWIDDAQYTREMNHSILAKKPVVSVSDNPTDGPPKLPVPINKMNCGLARTSLSRLLRYHCGKNPKYGTLQSMPVWWPNDVFEWTALKNLSHRYDGVLGDSYSNCLRLAIVSGYEFYKKDPYSYVEEAGDDLPTVAAIKRVKLSVNPQVSEMIQVFDDDIADDLPEEEDEDNLELKVETNLEVKKTEVKSPIKSISPTSPRKSPIISPKREIEVKKKRPPPPLIAIKDFENGHIKEEKEENGTQNRLKRKSGCDGAYGPLLSGRAQTEPGTVGLLKRCRVDVDMMGLDQIADEPVSVSGRDLLEIARSRCDTNLFDKMKTGFNTDDAFCDLDIVFSDGKMKVHKIVLAAASSYLHQMLMETDADSLFFPDTSLAVGQMAVEALYTGNVKINRKSVMSLSCVERCVRAFQQVGLLDNYSIQISSLLPLENFNPTKSRQIRPQSPPSSPSSSLTPPPPLASSSNNQPTFSLSPASQSMPPEEDSIDDGIDDAQDVNGEEEINAPDLENNIVEEPATIVDLPKVEPPKKKSSPSKTDHIRKDCNRPRFSELSHELLKSKEAESPGDHVIWLQDIGFLCSSPPRCKGCDKVTQLQPSPDIDGLAWKCPRSKDKCTVSPSLLREHSIFQFSKDKLLWILKIILCWRENTSLSQCHQETEASIDQIFFWYEKCRQFFGSVVDDEEEVSQ